jgi:hypothetical protein
MPRSSGWLKNAELSPFEVSTALSLLFRDHGKRGLQNLIDGQIACIDLNRVIRLAHRRIGPARITRVPFSQIGKNARVYTALSLLAQLFSSSLCTNLVACRDKELYGSLWNHNRSDISPIQNSARFPLGRLGCEISLKVQQRRPNRWDLRNDRGFRPHLTGAQFL